MRIGIMKATAVLAAAAVWMCIATPQGEAATCKTASCVKQKSATAKTSAGKSADKTATVSKSGKRKHHAASKTRIKSAHLKGGAKLADAAARGKIKNEDRTVPRASNSLPAAIANARAELTTADPTKLAADEAKNIAAADDNEVVTMNGVQIAAADQLNDIDRTAADQKTESKPDDGAPQDADITAAPTTPSVAAPAPSNRIVRAMPTGERHVVENHDEGTWSKTSLVGKIFVAFGSLLTLVSAARLMIA